MKTWDDWSDFEINCSVAISRGCDVVIEFASSSSSVYCGYEGFESTQDERDYCNNPADMWPVMVENKITTGYDGDGVFASQGELPEFPWVKFDYASGTCTALRAAAIVFLMMNGVNP